MNDTLRSIIDKFNTEMEEKGSYVYGWIEEDDDFATILTTEIEDEFLTDKVDISPKLVDQSKVREVLEELAQDWETELYFEKSGDYLLVMEA